jgi:anti-sigma B factor antagonist
MILGTGGGGVDHLTIEVREIEDACVLVPAGELDLASSPLLIERADGVLAEGRPVVVDLRSLTFIDSTGLSAIARIDRNAERAGSTLSLIAGPPNVQRVFEVSGTVDEFRWIDAPA